jgi:uncharacterized protein YcfJ
MENNMENTASPKRIHPLVATAAVSLTVFSLAGIAAVTGLLPTSHSEPAAVQAGAQATLPGAAQGLVAQNAAVASATPAQQAPAVADEPEQKPAVRHTAPRRHETVRESVRAESGQVAHQDAQPAPQPVQQAPQQAAAPQNSALGIGIGAVVGGLIGHQVGGGNGKKLATVAGAIGGGYLGNEIAKRNQQ